MTQQTALLDTCVLINLLASGECEAILRSSNRRWLICSVVERESIYLRTDDPNVPLELINLEPLISSGVISVCDVETEEESRLYVNYSSMLDDGEAMSLALALARGHQLATDERKAKRLFLEAVSSTDELIGTSQILREWVEGHSIEKIRAKEVLVQIANRARFFPPSSDVYYQWWSDICR
jgi:predicted nucleic acid-binding protein